jgi:uncharacterized membrane protein YGL010W
MAAVITPRLRQYFDEYASFHRDPLNKFLHYVGIPILTVTILALLAQVELRQINDWLRIDLGILLWLFVSIWYLTLSPVLGLLFSAVCLGLYFLTRDVNIWWLWGAFVLGWILQFVGHAVYEKKAPAFLKNFEHLFIGPLWVFAKATGQTR